MGSNTVGGADLIGHNVQGVTITIETRLFNSIAKFAGDEGPVCTLSLPAGSTVGDVIRHHKIPRDKIFLVMRNGRDVTPGLVGDAVNVNTVLDDGDVIALSGPVPYSYGYGAPVV